MKSKLLCFAIICCILLQFVIAVTELKATDPYTITVTNSTQGITGATVKYNISWLFNRSHIVGGSFTEWQFGDYYLNISNLTQTDKTYFIHLNISYGTNEIHLSDLFKVVSNFTQEDNALLLTYTDSVESNQASLQSQITQNSSAIIDTVLSNVSAKNIWNYSIRELTFYPLSTSIVSIDFSATGRQNVTYYHTEPAHILGTIPPENDESLATNYWKRTSFDIGTLPTNLTQGWLVYWLKKVGSPVTNLTIEIEGNVVNFTNSSDVSTSYTQYTIPFDVSYLTDTYVEVTFKGDSAWNPANYISLGADLATSTNTYQSADDGSSWIETVHEIATGLIIEHNQSFTALTQAIAVEMDPVCISEPELNESHGIGNYNSSELILALGDQVAQNTSAIMDNATTERNSILTYLINTIYAWLTTDTNIVSDADLSKGCINGSELNISHGIGNYNDSTPTTSAIAGEVWGWNISYRLPNGNYPNASEGLKTIAENTEIGGW